MALGRTSPRDLPLFADLSGREIKDIFRAGEEVSVPAGWSLILEQTPPDAAYLIISGTAAVRVKGEEIAELGPGDIAGEVAVRQNRLRTATVTAKSRLQLLHFTREKFDDLTNRLPNFRDAIDATIAERRSDNAERRSDNAERRSDNGERRGDNGEQRGDNDEQRGDKPNP